MKIQPVYTYMLLIFLGVTSCMGSSEETVIYNRLGVVQETPQMSFFTVDSIQVTAPFFENTPGLKAGDCFRINFEASILDLETKNRVYDVDVLSVDTIPVWKMSEIPTDTTFSSLQENEEFLSSIAYKQCRYVKERFFMTTEHPYLQGEEEVTFDLSANWDYEPVLTKDEKRIYELFVRVLKDNGKDTLETRWRYTNAFAVNDFVEKASELERGAGNDSLIFRLRYIKGYNSDSTDIRWEKTDTFRIKIPN